MGPSKSSRTMTMCGRAGRGGWGVGLGFGTGAVLVWCWAPFLPCPQHVSHEGVCVRAHWSVRGCRSSVFSVSWGQARQALGRAHRRQMTCPPTPLPCRPLNPSATQITYGNLKDFYWRVVEEKYPTKKLQALDDGIGHVIDLNAVLYTNVGVLGRYNDWWRGRGASTCLCVVVVARSCAQSMGGMARSAAAS